MPFRRTKRKRFVPFAARKRFRSSNAQTRIGYGPITRAPVRAFVGNVPRAMVGRMATGFPRQMKMNHKYCASITSTGGSGAMASHFFSCNGMFQPDISGSGHQPMYFDNMTNIYNHFVVIGSKITCIFMPNTTTETPARIAIWLNDDTTTSLASMDAMQENVHSAGTATAIAANETKTLINTFSTKKTFPGSVLGNPELRGNSVANPTEQVYYVISSQAGDLASSTNLRVQVCIEFTAIWFELREQAKN